MRLNELFRDGFSVGSLSKDDADYLLRYATADCFMPDKPGSPDIAEWETDNPSRNMNVPVEYLSVIERIGMGVETEHIRAHMGDWSRVNVMLQRGKRGDSMGWHHDSYDPMQMLCLIYLGDEAWNPEDGGQLQLGVGDINESGFLIDPREVDIKASVSPNHGTIVWAINTNPRWVHRVTEIECDKIRYTLIGQFGYRENVLRSNVAKRYGDTWR